MDLKAGLAVVADAAKEVHRDVANMKDRNGLRKDRKGKEVIPFPLSQFLSPSNCLEV